jgi:long-chain acyl-CoA synthetase
VRHWLQLDGEPAAGFRSFADLYLDGGAGPRAELDTDAPFTVLATAAVDVVPRGAILSHGNLLASNLQEMAAIGIGPADGNLVALPLFHIAALGHCLAHLHAGATNVIQPRWDATAAVRLIDRHAITHLSDFPPVLETLLDAAAGQGSKLPSLRWVSGLDSPATIERLHRETAADFVTGFGQAETTGFVTLQRARERLGAAGRTSELCRIKLVDDYDREVPAGVPGEIVVKGPLVFQGYDGQPEVTEMTFRGGWHHTGDVGRFDEDGFLHYVERKAEKELIKTGGENVYPAEVETVIVELEGVSAACVFGVPDRKWGEAIKAVVEARGSDLGAAAVIEHVGSRIARFKRPHHVEITDALPRTDDGAVDREAVKERWRPA